MTQRGLCSATASVWGLFDHRTSYLKGGRWSEIARIAQVLPKEKKKKKDWDLQGFISCCIFLSYPCFEPCYPLEYKVGNSKEPSCLVLCLP